MSANYQTELEALNALCDKTDAIETAINTLSSAIGTGYASNINELLSGVTSTVSFTNGVVGDIMNNTNTITGQIDATNLKLDSEIALTEGIRGAVVDVKNQPTDACIIRIYVGDQTAKRNAAAREITRLLGEGYRPYQTFGISEDLARVLFVKYPEPNDANEPEILP